VAEVPVPATTDRDVGETETVKSGGAGTTSVADAVWLIEPLVAVTVSGYEPGARLEAVVIDNWLLPDPPTIGVELKLHEAWDADRPERVRLISPAKPPVLPTDIRYEAVAPGEAVADVGDADMVKSGEARSQL
jgi:hypothetical protein